MKIRSDIIRMYRDIHSWVGIVCGLALFIAFYAGAITMFEAPLNRWASQPAVFSEHTPLEKTQELIEKVLADYPQAAGRYEVTLDAGLQDRPARVMWSTGPRGRGTTYYAELAEDGSLQVHTQGPSAVGQLVDDLHQQVGILLDHELVMPLVGAISLMYFIALVSGVIVLLPTLVKDLFILRIGKNLKRMWLDLHNALGLFSLPFHIIMALTAVVFAFHDLFYATQWTLLEKNGRPEAHEVSAGHREPLAPHQIVARLREQTPNFKPLYMQFHAEEDHGLELRVSGSNPRHGSRAPGYGIAGVDPYTGDLTSTDYMPGEQDAWYATLTSFFSLHFGNFGGNPIRWTYFLLGLAGAVLFYTGNLLWIESHRKKRRKGYEHLDVQQTKPSIILGALTVGISLGCIAGISTTIAAAKLLPLWTDALAAWHMGIYYTVFFLSVVWAFYRGAARGAVELLFTSAVATLLIPAVSLLSALFPSVGWNHGGNTYLIDVMAIIGAGCFAFLAGKTVQRIHNAPEYSIWYVGEEVSPTQIRSLPSSGLT